jgi:hypothetical protein
MTPAPDHADLIRRIQEMLGGFEVLAPGDAAAVDALGYEPRRKRQATVVLAGDTALELGAPGTTSVCRALWTRTPGLVTDRVYVLGEIAGGGPVAAPAVASSSFLLLALVELPEGLDPLESALPGLLHLTHRLPWVMTRALPGRLWIRVHRRAAGAFSLPAFARAVRAAHVAELPGVARVDVVIAAGDDARIRAFEPLAAAAGVVVGEHRRLRWEEDGEISCSDLDCRTCDEKPVCDTIREVIAFRRRK